MYPNTDKIKNGYRYVHFSKCNFLILEPWMLECKFGQEYFISSCKESKVMQIGLLEIFVKFW